MTTPTGTAPAGFWAKHGTQVIAFGSSIAITAGIIIFRDQLLRVGSLGYLGVFLVAVLGNATVILPVPSMAITFGGGTFLNPILVGLVAGVGEPLGELTGYMAGYGGSAIIEDRSSSAASPALVETVWPQGTGPLQLAPAPR